MESIAPLETPCLVATLDISQSESYISSRPPITPAKRLRSCLSPTRTPTGERTPASRPASRNPSFGSENSNAMDCWKRTKSVRWEGETEGCAVTSYHPTWSATEYDRTPLEPPSEAERTCVLPERGSRTFTTSYDCFDDTIVPSVDITEDAELPSSPGDEISHDCLTLSDPVAEESTPDEVEEDRQWEECMERRRRMFAMRRFEDEERQPQFEGYRSITAKLVSMLQSIEARRMESPAETDEEDEGDESDAPVQEDVDDEESSVDEEEDEGMIQSYSSFTFTNLQSLKIGRSDSTDETEETPSDDLEAATPSLTCSDSSEAEAQVISPRPSMMPISTGFVKGQEGIVEVGPAIAA